MRLADRALRARATVAHAIAEHQRGADPRSYPAEIDVNLADDVRYWLAAADWLSGQQTLGASWHLVLKPWGIGMLEHGTASPDRDRVAFNLLVDYWNVLRYRGDV